MHMPTIGAGTFRLQGQTAIDSVARPAETLSMRMPR